MTTADSLLLIYCLTSIPLEISAFIHWCIVRCIYGRRYETTTCLRTALAVPQENLTIMVVVALWPLYPVIAICCPPLWRGMRDAFFGIFELPGRHTRRGGHTTHVPSVPARDTSDWHHWLVLLRAHHQRIATARMSPRWRWYSCCSKGDNGSDVFKGVVRPPHEENDIEGGQENAAHDNAVTQFRQLLMRVVEYEEEGVFRSIVGYL